MEIININNDEYIFADYILSKALIYSKGCRSSRDLMRKKNINKENYIYARKNGNEYKQTDGKSPKFDVVLIKKSYINNIPELNKIIKKENNNDENNLNDNDNNDENNDIINAPNIIYLNDNEKFKDGNGKILEIETRGTREYDKIYFKVNDVVENFNLERLKTTLTNQNSGYEKNTDYKCFYICQNIEISQKNKKDNVKKELYFTFFGFRKMIEATRSFPFKTKIVMHKWLSQNFDSVRFTQFIIDLKENNIKRKIGYVYCITSNITKAVKIGFWKGTIESLKSRYKTYYGSNLDLYYVKTRNAVELEKKCHQQFFKYWITNELFEKEHFEYYKKYLSMYDEDISEDKFTKEIENYYKNDINNEKKDEISEEEFMTIETILMNKKNIHDCINYVQIISAPPLIYLNDQEKIKDESGIIYDVETRGNREKNQIYFSGYDLAKIFQIDDFINIISNDDLTYKFNEDYKYFNVERNNKIATELFLTYEGILRVLFVSRNNKTTGFIKWATQILFTHQMGTIEQKIKLAGDVMGVTASVMKEVLNTDTNTLPCVYLFTLGYVKDLRNSMNIDSKYSDNCIVAKYGFTKDLARRTSEHINTYGKIKNANLKLKYHSYIDPQYIAKGESDIRKLFDALKMNINYENQDEIVVIGNEMMDIVKDTYSNISRKYGGHISELITKIKDLENELENIKKDCERSIETLKEKYERELLNKENELLKKEKENELLKKEKENELLKKELLLQNERFEKELLRKEIEILKMSK